MAGGVRKQRCMPGFESQPCYALPVRTWACSKTCLSLSFLCYERDSDAWLLSCCKIKWNNPCKVYSKGPINGIYYFYSCVYLLNIHWTLLTCQPPYRAGCRMHRTGLFLWRFQAKASLLVWASATRLWVGILWPPYPTQEQHVQVHQPSGASTHGWTELIQQHIVFSELGSFYLLSAKIITNPWFHANALSDFSTLCCLWLFDSCLAVEGAEVSSIGHPSIKSASNEVKGEECLGVILSRPWFTLLLGGVCVGEGLGWLVMQKAGRR